MRWPVAVLALLAAPGISAPLHASPATPARIYLTADGPGVSESKEAQRLVTLLAKKLSSRKGLTLVESADEAQIHLDVREAEVFYENKVTTRIGRKGWRDPSPPNKLVIMAEQDFGVATNSNRDIVLVVRLREGDAFVDFDSAPVDRTLDAAADTVADEIARWIHRRPHPAP